MLSKEMPSNTHVSVLNNFEKYIETEEFEFEGKFKEKVLSINQHEPSKEFAALYMKEAKNFYQKAAYSRRFAEYIS